MKNNLNDMTQFSNSCLLAANWWVFALRGFIALIFGGFSLAMPTTTVLAMTIIFGAYALIDGVFYLVSGIFNARHGQHWGSLVISGILGIITGLVVLIMPQIAAISLTIFLWMIIAIWAISTGIFEVVAAVRLRREIKGEWFLALNGTLSILLGIGVLGLLWGRLFESII
ncbi:MAG: HdeD family acid-resistance protein, partial [Burkholderiales bacterium]